MLANNQLSFRKIIWILLMFSGPFLTAGCSPTSEAVTSRGTAVIIFIDFSSSIKNESQALYKRDIVDQIIPSLSDGDRILIAPINDKTLTDFHPLVEAVLPPKPVFNGWLDNSMKHTRLVNENQAEVVHLKDTVRSQVEDLFKGHFNSQYTDIFSSLIIAQKLFHNESRKKVLVLMSDMIEDYPPYNFEKQPLIPAASQKILSELSEKGKIPDLSGVCVYVTGVSGSSAEMVENIGKFWKAYFDRTKADMDTSRYAHVLLHWPPSKSCS
jgi:hypothetical protein